jgi:predicted ferric reductase
MFGPYGTFGLPARQNDRDMLWVAGGIGVTPFLALLQAESAQPAPRPCIRFVWSVRHEADAVYLDEIRAAVETLPHVQFRLHISEREGYLTPASIATLFSVDGLGGMRVFLCGPLPMMRGLKAAMAEYGIARADMVSEEFALR